VLRVPPEEDVPLDHGDLLPYVVAANLSRADAQRLPGVASGLRRLAACVAATWSLEASEPTGLGNRVRLTFQLFIMINVRYGDTTVFTHRFKPPRKHITLVPADKVDTFDPANEVDPHELLVPNDDDFQGLWARLEDFPVTHQLVNPALLSATAELVQEKLVLLQRAFYREVAQKSLEVEDDIQTAAASVDGIKLLWQGLVATGLPSSVEANDILRSLLFGSEAVLGGTPPAGEAPALDNVHDIYTFIAFREEDPPGEDILPQIREIAEQRRERLASVLAEIVASSSEPEAPELFAPTLLRLSLI
jgi:hypothetical protein